MPSDGFQICFSRNRFRERETAEDARTERSRRDHPVATSFAVSALYQQVLDICYRGIYQYL